MSNNEIKIDETAPEEIIITEEDNVEVVTDGEQKDTASQVLEATSPEEIDTIGETNGVDPVVEEPVEDHPDDYSPEDEGVQEDTVVEDEDYIKEDKTNPEPEEVTNQERGTGEKENKVLYYLSEVGIFVTGGVFGVLLGYMLFG